MLKWPDKFLAGAAGVAHGVATGKPGLTESRTPTHRNTTRGTAPVSVCAHRLVSGDGTASSRTQRRSGAAGTEPLAPSPKWLALKDPSLPAEATTAKNESHPASPILGSGSVVTDLRPGRLLAGPKPNSTINWALAKNQIEHTARRLMAPGPRLGV